MSSLKKVELPGKMVKGGSVPETSLKIPMPAGAKPPQASNKPQSKGK